jgi:glutaredoxin
MKNLATVYSRHGCHLCEVAEATLAELKAELDFELEIIFIDGDAELEKLYGHEVPVIHIDGEHHDFYKVDPVRFRSSLEKHRLHQ